jgi:hypothetical protein
MHVHPRQRQAQREDQQIEIIAEHQKERLARSGYKSLPNIAIQRTCYFMGEDPGERPHPNFPERSLISFLRTDAARQTSPILPLLL